MTADRIPDDVAAQERTVRVEAFAVESCFRCRGTGWLRRLLDGKAWSSSGPVPCECVRPGDAYRASAPVPASVPGEATTGEPSAREAARLACHELYGTGAKDHDEDGGCGQCDDIEAAILAFAARAVSAERAKWRERVRTWVMSDPRKLAALEFHDCFDATGGE